jgi:hypothetical protein
MDDNARLNELAGYEIEDLRAAGIEPTPSEIVYLSALGWAVQSPSLRIALARGTPVAVGGVTLWPLTLRGGDWHDRIGAATGHGAYALAYAMAHCYSRKRELYCAEVPVAWWRVIRWVWRLKCTRAALIEAIAQVVGQDEGPDMPPLKDRTSMSAGDMSAILAATCGGDPEFWERRCSWSYALDVLSKVHALANESGRPLASDPAIQATRALGWAVERIKARHAKEHGNG